MDVKMRLAEIKVSVE